MDKKTNNELKKLFEEIHQSNEYDNSKIAVPFVPYVGSHYWTVKQKVLIVGKATDGWGWKDGAWDKNATLKSIDVTQPRWFESLSEVTPEFIERRIIPFYSNCEGYSSLFWNRVYRILGKLLESQPVDSYVRNPAIAEKVFRSFAWTNVFKVTRTRGNPKKKLRNKQVERNTLKDEIKHLQPDAILFLTGPSYDRNIKRVLPGVRVANGEIAEVSGLGSYGFEGIALRTYHPQYHKFDMHEVVARLA